MAGYQFCFFDRDDRIGSRMTLDAGSDREAMDKAKKYLAEHPNVSGVEVLLGERRIARLSR